MKEHWEFDVPLPEQDERPSDVPWHVRVATAIFVLIVIVPSVLAYAWVIRWLWRGVTS